MDFKMNNFLKHPVGMRTFKTFLSVLISALVMKYVFSLPPFFACIGAVVATERTLPESFHAALIRNLATLIGAAVGVAIASFTENILILSLGIMPLIWISCMLKKSDCIVPGAIVYFAVAYLNTMEQSWEYGVTRFLGTLLGTAVALAVNFLVFPPKDRGKKQPATPSCASDA